MLLIFSNSFDVTTDLLIEKLPKGIVFRFNVDLAESYKVRFGAEGFAISDPTGRSVCSSLLSKAYWRKAKWPENQNGTAHERYHREEYSYLLREMVNWLIRKDKFVLVEPYAERRVGKLTQLEAARKYLRVPRYEVIAGTESKSVAGTVVTKSLSGATFGDKVLYTTRVHTSSLDPTSLWFLQELIEGSYEVTVAAVRHKLFAYKLLRNHPGDGLDWREFISDDQRWDPYELSEQDGAGIRKLMCDLGLHYARFDFILDKDNLLQFCELNPNGQFAWLDLDGTDGLLQAVLDEISPSTEIVPIPSH
jgi:hypothetical protein